MYSRSALNKLDIQVSFSSPRATEGTRLVLTTVLTNSKWLPLPWVAVKLSVSRHLLFADMENAKITDNYYRNDLYNILMRQRITRRLSFTCSKRGYYSIPTVDLTAWDILMESKTAQMVEIGASLTVYPGTLSMPEIDNLCVQIYGNLKARNIMHPDPFSFRGIREYSPNDPLKAVNFKASAKAQELMVNLWEYTNSRQVILMYNLERHSVWHNEVLDEHTIKIVASLAGRLISENVPVRFITNGQSISFNEESEPSKDISSLAERLLNADKDEPQKESIVEMTITEIPESVGDLHLEHILETLAYLDVQKTNVLPFSEILTKTVLEHKIEPEYWLVSTYHGLDLEETYQNLLAQGARAVWVLPHTVGLRTMASDINLSDEIRDHVILV